MKFVCVLYVQNHRKIKPDRDFHIDEWLKASHNSSEVVRNEKITTIILTMSKNEPFTKKPLDDCRKFDF